MGDYLHGTFEGSFENFEHIRWFWNISAEMYEYLKQFQVITNLFKEEYKVTPNLRYWLRD